MRYKLAVKYIIILLLPIVGIINIVTRKYPPFIERFYSNSINKIVRQGLSLTTGVLPFSVAEVLLIALYAILAGMLLTLIMKLRKGGFVKYLTTIVAYLSGLYILFILLWGLNYNRLSFDKIAKLNVEKSSKQQLMSLCNNLIEKANSLRVLVKEDSNGVMTIEGGYRNVFKRASIGYEQISKKYPPLSGRYGPPKPVFLSEAMCYTGITGMYMPYTGEANVNVKIEDFMLPNTTAHEMAHQRGFAKEDEANYISYLACTMHPDKDFQYSGVMLALINSMNALAKADLESYKQLRNNYSEGVKRDLLYQNAFWQKYSGKIDEISNKVNNTYLKSNGQQDGVASYGRMVDLLLAEYKK